MSPSMNPTEKRRAEFVKKNQELCDEVFNAATRDKSKQPYQTLTGEKPPKANQLIELARKELFISEEKSDDIIRGQIGYTWRVIKEGGYKDAS